MSKDIRLSDQQLQVVQALNRLGDGSAKDVQQALKPLKLAHTTVATVLTRLEKKGVLESEVRGRERVYHCVLEERALRRSMVSSLVQTLFMGDPKALVGHLVSEGEFDANELDELRDMIKQAEKPAKRGKKHV